MIKAGVDAYLDCDSTDEWSLDKLVTALYLAMSKATHQKIGRQGHRLKSALRLAGLGQIGCAVDEHA
jgi:hypothetical protein